MNFNYPTEPHDYGEVVDNKIGPFNNTLRYQCFSINITDDPVFENAEDFMVHLDHDPGTTRVSVDPNTTRITITDNDSELSSTSRTYLQLTL